MGLAAVVNLGQNATGGGGDIGPYLLGVGILLVVVVLSTIVLLWVRRKMLESSNQGQTGFSTMEELRSMVDRGDMTKEEYEQVRKAMIDKIRSQSASGQNGSKTTGDGIGT